MITVLKCELLRADYQYKQLGTRAFTEETSFHQHVISCVIVSQTTHVRYTLFIVSYRTVRFKLIENTTLEKGI